MTFTIDTGSYMPPAKSAVVDDGQQITFTNWTRADRCKRQVLEAIWGAGNADDLDQYIKEESLMIDALYLFDPIMADEIADAHKEVGDMLRYSSKGNPRPAVQDIPVAQNRQSDKGTSKMNAFSDFDTGGGGSEGPWLSWSARGSQDGAVPPKSFALRDQNGRTAFDMSKGIVLDIDNMKTGWCYSSGIVGQAPDWKWNPSISQFAQKPGDDYKKGFSIRCAIGGGNTATMEDSGAGIWNGFTDLVPSLSQGPGNGQLPLVRMTGAVEEKFARGSTAKPVFEVVNWVDRPDCLKEGAAAGIATEAPAPAPQAAPAPAPAGVDEF